MCSLSSKPLCIFEDRYRGDYPREGVFLVYPHGGEDLIRLEPLGYATTPLGLYERLLCDDKARIGGPLAGGRYDVTKFDFTLLRIPDGTVPELFVRLFRTIVREQRDWFGMYLNAEIHLRSEPSPFGTIRAVLAERDLVGA